MLNDLLPSLQFLVIDTLISGHKMAGKSVRAALEGKGVKKSGPAFYQLMARMEDAGWVEGWYEQKIVDGQIIKERWYRVKGEGYAAHNRTREFYVSKDAVGVRGGVSGA